MPELGAAAPMAAPRVPDPETRLPALALWGVPFVLVLLYALTVEVFFHAQAHWTDGRVAGITALLLIITALFSLVWYGVAYLSSLYLGDWVTNGVLQLLTRIPHVNRHVVLTPPTRPDRKAEVWGRFGFLLVITLGFELIFLILIVQRGGVTPRYAIGEPVRFFLDEFLAGLGIAVLIAPAAPFFASRVRTRITDSLEFPLLWLAILLLVIGGSSVLVLEVLPGAVFDPSLFLTSVLFYAPAAWYVSLAFSRSEASAQQRFLVRAWRGRGPRFHFGHLHITDDLDGTTTEV
jgi:hypothetical protein